MTVLQTRVHGARVLILQPPWDASWSVVVIDDRSRPDRPTYRVDGPYLDIEAALHAGRELARP